MMSASLRAFLSIVLTIFIIRDVALSYLLQVLVVSVLEAMALHLGGVLVDIATMPYLERFFKISERFVNGERAYAGGHQVITAHLI
jgi:hypothetical protein